MEQQEIKIVIPSAGRAKAVTTTQFVDGCILCVPAAEKEDYQKYNPGTEVVDHPDDVFGMGAKRNWICNHFGNVFMIDDDTTGIKRMYSRDGKKCSPAQAYDIIQYCGNMAMMMDCKVFGFNKKPQPLSYTGLKPFMLKGYINGVGIGMIKNNVLKFSTEITCNNDVFMTLFNAHHFHRCFIDNRYVVTKDSIAKNIGGMALHRTRDAELKDIDLLKKLFGNAVKTKQKTGSSKEYNIIIELPY